MTAPKKVVLAYSGGLDTSIILKWLETEYGCEVVTFTADLGQGEELEPARKKAELLGVRPENIFIEDLREEFVRDFVFPMFRANAEYEGLYLLGTSIARPLIAKRLVEIAAADRRRRDRARRHRQGQRPGAIRACGLCARPLDQGHRALARVGPELAHEAPGVRRGAPDPDRQGQARRGAVLGRREPAAHLVRGQGARGPGRGGAGYVYQRTVDPEKAPDAPEYVEIGFEKGDPVSIDGERLTAGGALDAAERARRQARRRPARPGREPLRRHEVARHLRDAGRHGAARRPPRHRVRSRSTGGRRTSRTS